VFFATPCLGSERWYVDVGGGSTPTGLVTVSRVGRVDEHWEHGVGASPIA